MAAISGGQMNFMLNQIRIAKTIIWPNRVALTFIATTPQYGCGSKLPPRRMARAKVHGDTTRQSLVGAASSETI